MGTSAFQFQIDYNPDTGFDPFAGSGGGGGSPPPPFSTQFDICGCFNNQCSTACTFANQFCYYDAECEPDAPPPPMVPPAVPPIIPPAVPPVTPPATPPVTPPPVAPPIIPPAVPPQAQPPAPLPPTVAGTALPQTTVYVQEAANGTAAIVEGVATGQYGRTVVVQAYPDTGYEFVRWDIEEIPVVLATPAPIAVTPPPTRPPVTPPPVTPPPVQCVTRGTLLNEACDGCTLRKVFADGTCGTYQTLENNNQRCCPTPPPITPPPVQTLQPYSYASSRPVGTIAEACSTEYQQAAIILYTDSRALYTDDLGNNVAPRGYYGTSFNTYINWTGTRPSTGQCPQISPPVAPPVAPPIAPPPVAPPPVAPPPVAPPPISQRGGGTGYCGECGQDSDCFFKSDGSFDPNRICDTNTGCCTSSIINMT